MFQTKVVVKIKTHILCSVTFLFENRVVYKIMWKNIVQPGRPQMTIWRMRIVCCIPKATNTHSDCVILIAFPLNCEGTNGSQCCILSTSPAIYQTDVFAVTYSILHLLLWDLTTYGLVNMYNRSGKARCPTLRGPLKYR